MNIADMNKVSFQDAKRIRLELLIEIDKFCRENNLTYFLAFGTLLGAIRHQGFIPWDDDADVMMPRPDLEKFLKIYPNNDKWKAVSNKDGNGQIWGFGRLVDNHTYRIQGGWKFSGVNVELYPIDGAPKSKILTKLFLFGIKVLQIVEARIIVKYRDKLIDKKLWPFKKPEWIVSKMFIWFFYKYGTMFRYAKASKVMLIFGNIYKKRLYSKSIFEESVDVVFEGNAFKAPKRYHEFLISLYGNYMIPPPPEQRRIHGGCYFYDVE